MLGEKTPHLVDVVDAVDASHVSQGLVGHHLRRVRRPRRVVWSFVGVGQCRALSIHVQLSQFFPIWVGI